ncbi:MAG TPA: hypothetical protein PLD25_11895 [Chloroflexota bacterium]|nr:hypothetical protein [Chloroflexota bacterium]
MKGKGCRRWLLFVVVGVVGLCLLGTAVSALSNIGLPTQSEQVDYLSENQKALLAEFFQVRARLGENVWPGWGALESPVVVYNEATAFLVNYPAANPPDGWFKVPQMAARGGPWQQTPDDDFAGQPYYRQTLPATGETPQAFTVIVGDRWAASMTTKEWTAIGLRQQIREDLPAPLAAIAPFRLVNRLLLRGSDGYISLLAHESFHAFQGTAVPERLAAAEMAQAAEADYPWADADLQADWQAELDLLAAALAAESVAETAVLTTQFLAQRQLRRQEAGLTNAQIDLERQREWLEGLARYVELEIWRQAAQSDYQPSATLADDGDFDAYRGFDTRWTQEVDQIRRMADDVGDGRFYYTGMAQAVLLDRLLPGWKEMIFADGVFLEDLLATAVTTP